MLGDIKNLTAHGPEHPALEDPASSRGFGLDNLKRSPLTSAVLFWTASSSNGS